MHCKPFRQIGPVPRRLAVQEQGKLQADRAAQSRATVLGVEHGAASFDGTYGGRPGCVVLAGQSVCACRIDSVVSGKPLLVRLD